MGKRAWLWELDGAFGGVDMELYGSRSIKYAEVYALLAIAERLGALVAIGDALEEVGDLWANTLTFGGQPVGEATPVEAFVKVKSWQCDKNKGCVFMKGHVGACLLSLLKHCQCTKPDFDASGVCSKCELSREVEDF